MHEPGSDRPFRSGLLLAAALGPAAALLREQRALGTPWLPGLWPVAAVVLAAGAGLLLGLARARERPRWPGVLVAIANAPVLLLYGFLLLFFGLGGSR